MPNFGCNLDVFEKFVCLARFADRIENSVYSFTSSAKSLVLIFGSKLSVISFMKRVNKRGPRTLPWGTPLTTGSGDDKV